MYSMSRRGFLKSSSAVLSVGMAMPSIFSTAVGAPTPGGKQRNDQARVANANVTPGRTLVVVQMAGGNDGLNMLVPYSDGRYYDARPTLNIPANTVLPLNSRIGLHPNMTGLHGLWQSGRVAIVEGVGYPDPILSHFESMDIWQSADQQRVDGWLASLVGGSVDLFGHPTLPGMAVGTMLPPALCCPAVPPAAISNPKLYRILPDPRNPADGAGRQTTLMQLYAGYQQPASYSSTLAGTANAAVDSSAQVQSLVANDTSSVAYPATSFAQGLRLIAEAVIKKVGLRVGYVTLGGFDTHSDQTGHQPELLQALSDGLAAFYQDLQANGVENDVVIMTWSEFGRRVTENASGGTDHGTAAPLFVIGGGVKGGLHGEPADLGNLDANGNLVHTTDFRSVYATMLEQWLGVDSAPLLGGSFPQLGLM